MKEEERLAKQRLFIEQAQTMDCHKDCDYSSVYFIRKDKDVQIFCKKCNQFFPQTPKNHLRGQSCPICGKEKARICHKGKYKHFIEESRRRFGDVYEFPNIENEFENVKSIVTIHCKKCDDTFKKRGCDHITSKIGGCYQCYLNNNKQLINFNELRTRFPDVDFIPFETAKDIGKDTVDFVCPRHGRQKVSLRRIMNENECKCGFCKIMDKGLKYEDIKEAFERIISDKLSYSPSEFVKIDKDMHFKCNVCGYEFERQPFMFLKKKVKHLCPNCGKIAVAEKQRKSKEMFVADAIKVYGADRYDFTDTVYNKSNLPVTIKCNECGRKFTIEANSFLQGHGCPYHNCNSSLKEKEVAEFIRPLGVENVLTNDRTLLDGEELDIYLPDYNVAFEFNGLFWHTTRYKKDKFYHINKTKKCLDKGVTLYHIFEDEWNYRKEVWKSIIRKVLNKDCVVLNAENCEIRFADKIAAKEFLETNAMNYDSDYLYLNYGLFYENKLIMMISLFKIRRPSEKK